MRVPIWIPRGFVLLVAAFYAFFSIDVFSEHLPLMQMLLALFMHNIPSLVILAALFATWKSPKAAAIVFFLVGGAFMVFYNTWRAFNIWAALTLPFLLITLQYLLAGLDPESLPPIDDHSPENSDTTKIDK